MKKNELIRRYGAGERDFIGVDLRNIYLNWPCLIDINLSYATLESSDLMLTHLINANLSGANMEKAVLNGSFLINANLSGSNLRNAKLTNADLNCANLTNADLSGADLSGVALIGTNLTGANITNIKTTEETIFCNTTMPDGSLQNDPERVIDSQELLRRYTDGERDFTGIVLHRVDLSGANLRDALMWNTYLSYVNLSHANLENSDFGKVIYCDLKNAKLRHSNLRNAQLIYSDLRGADLQGVDLSAADLTGTNFQGANNKLSGIDNAFFLCNTTWITGEFISGPINCDSHWRGPIIEGEF